MNNVKFHKYFVTDGTHKARVRYSPNIAASTSQNCITLYEKDYSNDLPKIFDGVRNDTDVMTDYFESNSLTFLEGSPEYDELLLKMRGWGMTCR